MILPPADFVQLFMDALVTIVTSAFLPITAVMGVSMAFVILSWVLRPYGEIKRMFGRF